MKPLRRSSAFFTCILAALVACSRGPDQPKPEGCKGPCCEGGCDPCAEGACVAPLGWDGPVLLWVGDGEGEAPACPEAAPRVIFEGGEGLSTRQECPTCSCTAPECVLPGGVLIWNVKFCDEEAQGAEAYHVAPPEGWDGACVDLPPQPPLLHYSVRVLGTSLTPCEVITGPEPVVAEVVWSERARACAIDDLAAVAAAAPAPFARCVWQEAEVASCPERFPVRRVFFEGAEGALGCSACTCGEPEGSRCRAYFGHGLLPDACQGPAFIEEPVELGLGSCGTVLSDAPVPADQIETMAATWLVNTPGACPPAGGAPVGEVAEIGPATFCCEAGR